MDQNIANVLLSVCDYIDHAENEKRAAVNEKRSMEEKLSELLDSLSDKGIISPEKRAYLNERIGVDNLEVLDAMEKSASRHSADTSLGSPSAASDVQTLDPIARFALS